MVPSFGFSPGPLIMIFKSSFLMAFCLNCYSFVVGDGVLFCFGRIEWGQGCHRSLLCLFFSTVCLQSSMPLEKWFPCPLQSAWITDFHMVSGDNTGYRHSHGLSISTHHRPQHGLQWQYRPWTLTRPSVTAWASDSIVALSSSAGQGCQCGRAHF